MAAAWNRLGAVSATATTALWLVALWLVMAGLPGCSSDRTVTQANMRYACSSSADCVTGYGCVCGFCQPAAAGQVSCLSDAGTSDSGPADTATKDTATNDGGTTDVGVTTTPCNPGTWVGCKAGEGCYWDESLGATVCLPHGKIGLNGSCSPDQLTECGRSSSGEPLLCDAVDERCLRLCNTTQANCPTGLNCYVLQDSTNQDWPDNAGICAP